MQQKGGNWSDKKLTMSKTITHLEKMQKAHCHNGGNVLLASRLGMEVHEIRQILWTQNKQVKSAILCVYFIYFDITILFTK